MLKLGFCEIFILTNNEIGHFVQTPDNGSLKNPFSNIKKREKKPFYRRKMPLIPQKV